MADYLQKGFAAASIGLRATFDSAGMHTGTHATSIDGQSIDVGMDATMDTGFDPSGPVGMV